jgi:ankyrin repeat protein
LLDAALSQKADVNCASPGSGLPPLLEMLRSATAPLNRARRECVACLLAHGAKPDVVDGDRRTAVIYATRLGDLETLRLLVEAEAYVRTRDCFHKTALFYAVEAGRRDIALYLAQNGGLISLSVKERRQMERGP